MKGLENTFDGPDDWKNDYLSRLQQSFIFSSLKEDCINADVEVLALVEKAVAFAIKQTKTIIRHMGEYTLHDEIHLFRVLYLMERLLTRQSIKQLTVPERLLLILSAFFHDIGMAPAEKEVSVWSEYWNSNSNILDTDKTSFTAFSTYLEGKADIKEKIDRFYALGDFAKADLLKSYLISDYIRYTHADRARAIIAEKWNGKIKYRDTDLTVELANVCNSHNEDALKLLDFDKNYPCGNNAFVCLPLIGVILRLADILDFDSKRTPEVLFSHLYVRNPVSVAEWQKHRAVENWTITPDTIQFAAKCSHPAIEASIQEFCDIIDKELSVCSNILTDLQGSNVYSRRQLEIKIPFEVDRSRIRAMTDIYNNPSYFYSNTKFTLSKRQVIDLLMGTKLYGDPQVALRELIQNSIDACLLRKAMETSWGRQYEPTIFVRRISVNGQQSLVVGDNGTGMDKYIIDNYYTKIGRSFYTSSDFNEAKYKAQADFTPTSRFGIGILACFMVADTLTIDTMKILGPDKSSEALNILIEGEESIFWIKQGNRQMVGTTTELTLRDNTNPWKSLSDEEFSKSVQDIIINPKVRIQVESGDVSDILGTDNRKKISVDSLKDYTWDPNENIKRIEINFADRTSGITGSALVAILEDDKMPVSEVTIEAKKVRVENTDFELYKRLRLSGDKIIQESSSIGLNHSGEIKPSITTQWLMTSKAKISLHSIFVPHKLFPESWEAKKEQAKLEWPFPLILVADISGPSDLDLNSSRTTIVMSEKWVDVEEELAFQVCKGIAEKVDAEYWNDFKKICTASKSPAFLRGLSKVY